MFEKALSMLRRQNMRICVFKSHKLVNAEICYKPKSRVCLWVCACVLKECFVLSLCVNYVTFPTVRVFFVRWGKARGKCWNKALSRCVCVFHSVCLDVRGSWYSADQVPTMAPAPRKDRKRYRGQNYTERKREGKEDGGEDRWDKREREMKAERTWGGEEECYIFCAPAHKNKKKL